MKTLVSARPESSLIDTPYSSAHRQMWRELFARQLALLPARGCHAAIRATEALAPEIEELPCLDRLSAVLNERIGWRIVPVDGLIEPARMFHLLADRVFAVSQAMRSVEEMDFAADPDLFHDVFGHLPLLLNPSYRRFLEGLGRRGRRATPWQQEVLARLMWFSTEVGLVLEGGELRALGGALLSSRGELSGLERREVAFEAFDFGAVASTLFQVDSVQDRYYYLDSVESLPHVLRHFDVEMRM
ncbi:MAG: phenylalanine 4-monooxygenase [Planctomycetota bacterium]